MNRFYAVLFKGEKISALLQKFIQFRSDTRLRIASGVGVPFTHQQITFGISLGEIVSQEYGNA
jgi:hypothetical protein